jgi:hypothetical protein
MLPMTASAGGKVNSSYDGRIDFGPQVVQLDDGCLAVDGKISAEAFFDDLKRVEIRHEFEFRRRGLAVTEYPDSVTTTIRIAGGQCASGLADSASSVFRDGSYALSFHVEWKRGMQLRPAALTPVAARCTGYSTVPITGQERKGSSVLCQLSVESKGVPLVDHLIVSVFAPDGKRLTRLSARP